MTTRKKNDVGLKKCTTPNFRVSYPHVFKPTAGPRGNGDPKFQVTMLFTKDTDLTPLKKAAHAACVQEFGPDKTKWPKLRSPFRDGDTEKGDQEGYKGNFFMIARSKQKPGLIDQAKNPITEESGAFYAGCYARATLIAFVYEDYGNGRGISFTLMNIQKVRDGKSFSGRKRAEDEFGELPMDGDSPSDYDAPTTTDDDDI